MDTLMHLLQADWARTLAAFAALLLLAWLTAVVTRAVLLRVMRSVSERTVWTWDDALVRRGVFRQLARVAPLLVLKAGLPFVPGTGPRLEALADNLFTALIVLVLVLAASAALSALEDLHDASPRGRERSIKGYVQLTRIGLFLIGAIVIIAFLIGRSPMTLIAGLGAVSAVLLLIFKDTLLSIVASVQLASNDMLRVGDWISLPEDDVDGDVIEIALHTIKVVNWDKTISTVPTWHLIEKSYRNYRHMYATGRRIRRALHVDLTSVRFLTGAEIDHLRGFKLLQAHFGRKDAELAAWNERLEVEGWDARNTRRLTNLGCFRAYVQAYVEGHPGINAELFWAVRQLDPEPTGIPIQIYAYTRDTGFVAHHEVQGDIFDHLIAILPEFGLRLFQQPSGTDLRALTPPATDARQPARIT